MQYTTPRSTPWALAALILASVLLTACGAAGPTASPSERAASAAVDDSLTEAEFAKLDDALREHVRGVDETLFPVRVKFAATPSRAELSGLFLVAMDRDAVGRVDRPTLKAIAARGDVSRILYVDAGYAEDDGEFD